MIYAMERLFLDRLRADRQELFAIARSVKSAVELRALRDDLMASATIYKTPANGQAVEYEVIDGVAHIPVVGELTPSADPCGALTGNAETEYGFIQAALIAAEDNPAVREIVLDVNSPGGYIDGLDETAQILAMVSKPTIARVGSMAASAAYWLASQADLIEANSPASVIGSIGVAIEEYDNDEALKNEGVTRRVYTSTEAPDKRPDTKTEDGRAKVVAHLDELHAIFVRRVAEGRGVSEATVKNYFGKGGTMTAEKAYAVCMIDAVIGSHIGKKSLPKSEKNENEKAISAGVAGDQAAGPKEKGRVKNMTAEQIKAENPDAAAALRDEGIQAERKRVAKLLAYKGQSAVADKVVDEAIASGKAFDEVDAQIITALVNANAPKADGENPPIVASGTSTTGAGVSDTMDEEDKKAMEIFGMSAEDYRKYGKGRK